MQPLIAQGRTDFEHIREIIAKDSFFDALEINRIPSAEILRQQFKNMNCSKFAKRIVICRTQLVLKTEIRPKYTIIGKRRWVRKNLTALYA